MVDECNCRVSSRPILFLEALLLRMATQTTYATRALEKGGDFFLEASGQKLPFGS